MSWSLGRKCACGGMIFEASGIKGVGGNSALAILVGVGKNVSSSEGMGSVKPLSKTVGEGAGSSPLELGCGRDCLGVWNSGGLSRGTFKNELLFYPTLLWIQNIPSCQYLCLSSSGRPCFRTLRTVLPH